METRLDPSDNLPAMDVGEWADEKHEHLKKFLDISHAARRKFVTGRGGATYIELFSGPGRLFVKGTGEFVDGSPLVAHREAARTATTFNAMHLGDERQDFCDAASARLKALGATPITYPMEAQLAARRIVEALSPHGLHFAFLDPFNIESLPFTIIQTLARIPRMDVLIHVSAMDLQRKLPLYMADDKPCALDGFAPDWRKAVAGMKPDIKARGKILEHWISLIRGAGFREAESWELIRGPSRQALYWLVLVAKHDLATKFWDAINRPHQGGLFADA